MIKSLKFMLIIPFLLAGPGCSKSDEKEIRTAVERILHRYPASTLQDLYKSFFQDYFGPGHMISDTAAARNYLAYELGLDDYRDTVLLERTGYHGNFYRVNLALLKNEVIPADTFFTYFLSSVNAVQGISMKKWKSEWKKISGVIDEMNPGLANYREDREVIDSLLDRDEYVVHHSQAYLDAYHPHYRIIHREIFDRHLRKYLHAGQP